MATGPTADPSAPPRILLVEDDLDQAHLVKFLLEDGGRHEVTLAQDGMRGAALVEEQEWELVITDLNLPGADGIEVMRACRRYRPDTPILATTGYTDPEYLARAKQGGADDVLVKPLGRDELLDRVGALLAREVEGPEEVVEEAWEPSEPEEPSDPVPLRVLAVSVRPGDAEIGCGATLIQHRERGDRVVLLTLSHGFRASGDPGSPDRAKEAGRLLGVRFFVGNAGSGDDPMETDLRRLVSGAVHEIRPDVLYLPTPEHEHPAFRAVYDDALAASERVECILTYDPGDAAPSFHPEHFVQVAGEMEGKVEALRAFAGSEEKRLTPESAGTAAEFWSRHTGSRPAEAFRREKGEPPLGG